MRNKIIDIIILLENDCGFATPDVFNPKAKPPYRDLKAFIDVEFLFLENFKFRTLNNTEPELKKINNLYAMDKKWFQAIKLDDHFDQSSIEEREIGMGYSVSSGRGKGPDIEEADKIKKLLKDSGSTKHLNLFKSAKSSKTLKNIGPDKFTDFFVRINRENLFEASKILINYAIKSLGFDNSVTTDEVIKEFDRIYKERNKGNDIENDRIYFIPLEIVESIHWDLGIDFQVEMWTSFLYGHFIVFDPERANKILGDLNSLKNSSLKKTYINDNYGKIISSESAKKIFNDIIKEEIHKINKIKSEINSIEDLKIIKGQHRIDFILKDQEVLEKLNIFRNIAILPDSDNFYKIFIYFSNEKGEIFIIRNQKSSNLESDIKKLNIKKSLTDPSWINQNKIAFINSSTKIKNINGFNVQNSVSEWN